MSDKSAIEWTDGDILDGQQQHAFPATLQDTPK